MGVLAAHGAALHLAHRVATNVDIHAAGRWAVGGGGCRWNWRAALGATAFCRLPHYYCTHRVKERLWAPLLMMHKHALTSQIIVHLGSHSVNTRLCCLTMSQPLS